MKKFAKGIFKISHCSKVTSKKVRNVGHYPIVRHDKNYKKIFFQNQSCAYIRLCLVLFPDHKYIIWCLYPQSEPSFAIYFVEFVILLPPLGTRCLYLLLVEPYINYCYSLGPG